LAVGDRLVEFRLRRVEAGLLVGQHQLEVSRILVELLRRVEQLRPVERQRLAVLRQRVGIRELVAELACACRES
jgi:hypothetical protein